MNSIPDFLGVKIIDEVLSIPFVTMGFDFKLSCFNLESLGTSYECMCLHKGDLSKYSDEGIPVRIHSGCITSEIFGSKRCDCFWQLEHSINYINEKSKGILIYCPWQEGCGNGLFQKIKSFRLMDLGMTTSKAFNALGLPADKRDYMPAITILFRFGLLRVQLITNNPRKIAAVNNVGIEIVRRIPSIMKTDNPNLLKYLKSKDQQLGHLIYGEDHEELCR